jgi:hypothetical protein
VLVDAPPPATPVPPPAFPPVVTELFAV